MIKDLAVSLAMLTYTPISYFLSLTLEEFRDSVERVNRLRGGENRTWQEEAENMISHFG